MGSVYTRVNLARIRANAQGIVDSTGVELIAVVKANAYGHGAVAVADAINDLVSAWYVFTPHEAVQSRLFDLTGKSTLAAYVLIDDDVQLLADNGVRPAVWTLAAARRFAALDPVLAIDTGMQRFACAPDQIDAMFAIHDFTEAFTHASRAEQAMELSRLLAGRPAVKKHAAVSALMNDPRCRLDAVRPGLALYEGAARVTARLVDVRTAHGPAGYTGFSSPTGRHGILFAGYSDGLRAGPVRINGRPQRLLEVGMQSSYVSVDPADKTGDEVVLLGDDLSISEVAAAWGTRAQQTMCTLVGMGEKIYA